VLNNALLMIRGNVQHVPRIFFHASPQGNSRSAKSGAEWIQPLLDDEVLQTPFRSAFKHKSNCCFA
jgi:hypothetical protein